MSKESQDFVGFVKDNKMLEAKQVFLQAMNQRISKILSEKRVEVAKQFFNKNK